ncbi:hypothetical protein [Streptomyces sp. NPDC093970]|uniref:hypothetical protein n=1 Tax=Streptomyces sp. NPDC093970 TaxID=3155076 RepID=UPI003434AE0A
MTEHIENGIGAGSVVYDTRADRVGEYRGESGPYVLLRPLGGGREWEAHPESVRPATAEERLGAEVRAANHRSRALSQPVTDSPAPEPVAGCAACAEFAGRRRHGPTRARSPTQTCCSGGTCAGTTGAPAPGASSASCRT